MRRTSTQSLMNQSDEIDPKKQRPGTKNRVTAPNHQGNDNQALTLYNREPTRRGERPSSSCDKYGLWRQEQRTSVARLEKQLKARWALEEQIEEQLNRFNAHFNRAIVGPIRLKDVSQLLMPKWAPPHELAALSWLGDWRPSAILSFLRYIARYSLPLSDTDSTDLDQVLSQLIHDIRIDEAVIDGEMAEIQTNCILHLPFGPVKTRRPSGPFLTSIRSEFKKIHRVITKAQKLRVKALEMAVQKVLGQTDAAEFLVSFAAIQDSIHRFTEHYNLQKGPVSVPVKPVGYNIEKAESVLMKCEPQKNTNGNGSRAVRFYADVALP